MDTICLHQLLPDQSVLGKNNQYVLFGADYKGADLYDLLSEGGYKVLFFVDNNAKKQNTTFCGLDVLPPSVLLNNVDCFVIITSAHVGPIKNQLECLGVSHIIIPKVIDLAPFGRRKAILREIHENQEKIALVLSYLEDELSKKSYKGIIAYCQTLNLDILRDIYDSRFPQYFDDEIIQLDDQEVFVDGGSLDFETSLQFIKKVNGNYKKIFAFEPDRVNCALIADTAKGFHHVEVINKGIYSEEAVLKFKQNGSFDSMFATDGDFEVAVDSLDHIVTEPTFIKFDIEGCELSGLLGSEKIIKKYKPKLAICIYHKLSDLWTIPLCIKEYCADYKLYIRHYSSHNHMETVCYAVAPPKTV